jgi:hypothetical protein
VVGERFAAVLLAAVSETGESIDAATVTRLALAACHPVTAVSTRPRRHLWTAVMRALPIIPDIIRGTRAATSFRNIRRGAHSDDHLLSGYQVCCVGPLHYKSKNTRVRQADFTSLQHTVIDTRF